MTQDAIIATLLLGGMCFAMWFLARVAKRRMGVGAGTISGAGLRVVGKRPLDQKNALYVVEIAGGRHILVGASAEGGGISKVDDISIAEYEAMTADEAPTSRPKLRLARGGAQDAATPAEVAAEAAPGAAVEAAIDGAADDDAAATEAEEQRFATVGESFQLLLGKARDARSARRDRAVGDE